MKQKSNNNNREIASASLFPFFRYNPDTTTMVPANKVPAYYLCVLCIIHLWSWEYSVISPKNHRGLGILCSCAVITIFSIYIQNVTSFFITFVGYFQISRDPIKMA